MKNDDEQSPPVQPKDVWSQDINKEHLTTLKILDQIKGDLTPVSSQEYLSFKSTNLQRLEHINSEQLKNTEMFKNCLCSIVVPAHNENTLPLDIKEEDDKKTNIIKFLETMNNQSFSEKGGLKPENFEVIIVDNNSTDGTGDAARKWVQENNPTIPIHIISINFSDEEKGVGSARKLGADLSILRANKRVGGLGEHYIGGLDSDNHEVSLDHFEKIVHTFRTTNAVVLKGETYNSEDIYRMLLGGLEDGGEYLTKALLEFRKFKKEFLTELSKIHNEFFSLDTSGANHAIRTETYMQIRGYPPKWKTGEDTYPGRAVKEALKRGVGYLPSEVVINPRRLLLNPVDYYDGKVWEPRRFSDDNDKVRSGEKSTETSLSLNRVEKGLVKTTDQFALEYITNEGQASWHDAVIETRKILNNLCDKYSVPNNQRPSTEMFYTGRRILEDAQKNGNLTVKSGEELPNLKEFKPFVVTEDYFIQKTENPRQNNSRLVFIKTDPEGIPLL